MSSVKQCSVKAKFPIFKAHPELIYLDSAATTHKPQSVIDTITRFYESEYATVHRSVYSSAMTATDLYAQSRAKVAQWIGAKDEEIVFTSGTTEAINLVAHGVVRPGDEVIITEMEHHSNIVPWQLVCQERGATLKVVPLVDGKLDMQAFRTLLSNQTRIVAVAHISNSTGERNPIEQIIEAAHEVGAQVLIDGAQAIAHEQIDMSTLGADFYAFSGHKMYGPTGIGVLYGRNLNALPPFLGGGDMIDQVTFEQTTFQQAPLKFEAGTPKIAQVIGLGSAVDFMQEVDFEGEREIGRMLHAELAQIDRVRVLGEGSAIATFVVEGAHPLDVASMLDFKGVAIRSGHLCAQPTMAHFGISSALRASIGIYNDEGDVTWFIESLKAVLKGL